MWNSWIFRSKIINPTIIEHTLNLMKHRGPDSDGKFIDRDQNLNRIFLHSRLSIIDLKDQSNQPFEDEKYILIYNGEIYNYLEIKEDLKKRVINLKQVQIPRYY